MDRAIVTIFVSPTGVGSRLEVVRLDKTSWRVSDPSIDERGSARLLGYLERLARDRYEVLWLDSPVCWAYVASFKLALAALAARTEFSGVIEPERLPTPAVARAMGLPRYRRRERSEPAQLPVL